MKCSSRINSEHPPRSRNYSLRGFAGARRSDKGSDATTSIEIEQDTSRVKRVRFSSSDANHCSNAKPGATSVLCEATKAARSDVPKTSEFAFFKKIKEKACSASYPSHKEDDPWNDAKSRESGRETPIMFERSASNLRTSLPVDKARPINQHYSASPSDDASHDLGLKNAEPICKIITSPQPIDKLEPCRYNWFSPPFGAEVRNSGVFSEKRRKLRQWVADTSLPKVDELSSKGSSLVYVLLSRLFPENSAERYCRNPKSRDAEKDIEHEQTLLPRSETHVNGLQKKPHKVNLNASKQRPYIDDGFAKYWSRRHRDIDILQLDSTICSDSPSTSYTAKTPTDYSYSRSLCNVDQTRIPSFWRHSESSFHESFEGHDSIPCVHLKEREYLLDYKQPKSRPQPRTLLLGWDDNEKHKQKMAAPSFLTDVNSFLTLETKWADDNEHGMCSELMSLSPLFSKDSSHLPLPPHYHIDSLPCDDFQSHLGEEKYQSALTLSGTPKYLKLVEDSITQNMLESSSIELPPRDYVREKVCCSLEPSLFPTRLDFASGWRFLSMAESFDKHRLTNDNFWLLQKEGLLLFHPREDDNDNSLYRSNYLGDFSGCPSTFHDQSVSEYKLSRDTDIGRTSYPLVLHDPSWDICEEESYREYKDDGVDEWKYV